MYINTWARLGTVSCAKANTYGTFFSLLSSSFLLILFLYFYLFLFFSKLFLLANNPFSNYLSCSTKPNSGSGWKKAKQLL